MKTFDDLQFTKHHLADNKILSDEYKDAKQARMDFDNGYGISVLFGRHFYSNGIDTYEVAVIKGGTLCYDTNITDDVLGEQTKEMVTSIMAQIQNL